MGMFKFLAIPTTLFLFTYASHSIPIYPDDNHDDWMVSKKLDDKTTNLANNNKSINAALGVSTKIKDAADVNIQNKIINQLDTKIDEKTKGYRFFKRRN